MRTSLMMMVGYSIMVSTLASAQAPSSGSLATQRVTHTVADQDVEGYEFETHYLYSADLQRRYRVYLALPNSPVPVSGRPSIYMLDGNAVMATLTAYELNQLSQLANPPVLVAIGYDIETRNDVIARSYDYTPPVFKQGQRVEQPIVRGRVGGGADTFLAFITETITPLIATRVLLDSNQTTLWGHSYGGLFVMYASAQAQSPFQHYRAADPSLWWYDQALVKTWGSSSTKLPKGRTVSVYMGTKGRGDQSDTPSLQEASLTPLIQRLDTLQKMSWQITYHAYPQYDHGDMIGVSLRQMLNEFILNQKNTMTEN